MKFYKRKHIFGDDIKDEIITMNTANKINYDYSAFESKIFSLPSTKSDWTNQANLNNQINQINPVRTHKSL